MSRGKAPLVLAVGIGIVSGRLDSHTRENTLTLTGYYIWQPYFEEKESVKFKQQQYVCIWMASGAAVADILQSEGRHRSWT